MAKRVYQKAKQGERMIELKVCFWTDGWDPSQLGMAGITMGGRLK